MSNPVPSERSLGRRYWYQIVGLSLTSISLFCFNAMSESPALASEPAPSVQHPEVHPVWRTRDPHLVREVKPTYPEVALRQGIEKATVIFQVVIDRHGRVKRPQVLRCTPPGRGFEEPAVKAVKKWRYEPAQVDGDPVDVYFTVEVTFEHSKPET